MQCWSAKFTVQGMFTSFPLSYFRHLILKPALRSLAGTSAAGSCARPGTRRRWDESTSTRWQAATDSPWLEAKPGISRSEKESKRRAMMGTMRLHHPNTTPRCTWGQQLCCQPGLPTSICNSQPCPWSAFQNIGCFTFLFCFVLFKLAYET